MNIHRKDSQTFSKVNSLATLARQWSVGRLPAGKRWISAENGEPDLRCPATPVTWDQNHIKFEQVQAQQVPMRLSACADNGDSICLWFSLFDLRNEADVFTHLGLLDPSVIPPRKKPHMTRSKPS